MINNVALLMFDVALFMMLNLNHAIDNKEFGFDSVVCRVLLRLARKCSCTYRPQAVIRHSTHHIFSLTPPLCVPCAVHHLASSQWLAHPVSS
jgi:hypothetical protein